MKTDIAIVGAGIAGASLAYRLAPHARVLLLEREAQPGLHSTGRSAAMFMESYGSPQGRALTRASRAFYAAPPAGFTEVPLLAPRGVLYVAGEAQRPALAALATELRASGVPLADCGTEEALARCPVLRPEAAVAALHEPDAMDVDVHALHQCFLRGARAAGATVLTDAKLSAAQATAGHWRLRLADGRELEAEWLVNAAGAWADGVAAVAGIAPLGLQPCRRSAFTFDVPAGLDARTWPSVVGADESWYFKPDAGQLLGSPANADPVPAHDVVAEELDVAHGIARIEAATTLTIRRPRRTWAGLRTFAPDGEMAIGADAASPRFFWLAGQGGWGIQSAAGASALAAALLLGQPPGDELRAAGVDARAVDPARLRR